MSNSLMSKLGETLAHTSLQCFWCGARRPADLHPTCRECGGTLIATTVSSSGVPLSIGSLLALSDVIPVSESVSMGEGGTPLLRLFSLFPDAAVYAKADWMNPTGSFKDRGAASAVSISLALGAPGLVCASTGNNGASVSAYAARAGLPCIVVLPAATPLAKVAQARAAGASVATVAGSFSDAYRYAAELAEQSGWANLTSTYINPYMTAAHASIAFELYRQLGGSPGSVFMPVGSGPMLDGVMRGAAACERLHPSRGMPLPVAVQAAACSPIAKAFESGADSVTAWEDGGATKAGSIADPLQGYPEDGTRTLRFVRAHNGRVVAVDEDEIDRAMADLAHREGLLAEPAAAACLAALRKMLRDGEPVPQPIVLVLSGHALKDPAALNVNGGRVFKVADAAGTQSIVRAALDRFQQNAGASPE